MLLDNIDAHDATHGLPYIFSFLIVTFLYFVAKFFYGYVAPIDTIKSEYLNSKYEIIPNSKIKMTETGSWLG